MALPLIPLVIAGATWLSRIGLAVFAVNEIKKLVSDNKPTLDAATSQAEAAGLSSEEQQKMVAAVTYEQVEKQGKSPDAFWGNLTLTEQNALKFSPESLRADTNRTNFLGIAQTLLWIGAGVALARAGFKGLPASLKGLADINALKLKGVSPTVIANELQIMKTAILNKTWIPGSVAGILATGGWIAGGLMNNLNDATLWGRIFLDQAHSDVEKAAANAAKGEAGFNSGAGSVDLPKTIIRMVKEEKPVQFIGTLFSSKLGKAEQFDRHLDDRITDMQDLEADVKINLNRWLASLPNRMGYSIVIRKDPVDEFGAQQSGIWATLTMFMTHISGKTTPIDTVLLGPVDPQVRLELQRKTTTIENHISGFIDATTVREIQIPDGSVDIFNASGERVLPSNVAAQVATPATPAPATPAPDATKKGPRVDYLADINAWEAFNGAGKRIDLYSSKADAYRAAGIPIPFEVTTSASGSFPIGNTQTSTPATLLPQQPVTTASGGAKENYSFPRTVTVTVDALMVRSSPSSTAPLAGSQRLVRGNTFVAVGEVQGESVDGNNWWWKSEKGNFVWSGGTDR